MSLDPATIAETSPALLAVIDTRGVAAWINESWSAFTGQTSKELLGNGWATCVHEADTPGLLGALETGRAFSLDVRMHRHDGRLRWLTVRASQTVDGNMLLAALDVSEAHEAQRAAQMLAAIGEEVNASLALDETLAGVARFLAGEFADYCSVAVFDRNGKLERIGLAHADKEMDTRLRETVEDPVDPDGSSALAQVVRSGTMLYRPLVDAPGPDEPWPPLPSPAGDESSGFGAERSLICVALRVRDEVVGAIAFVSWSRRFTPDDVMLAEEIAQRIAVAVDNVMLFRRSEDTRARLSLIASVGEQLALTLDTQTVFDTLVERVVPLFADAAVAAVLDEDTGVLERRAVRHRNPAIEAAFRNDMYAEPMPLDARWPPARAARTRKPVLIEDYDWRPSGRAGRERADDVGRMLEASSVLSVPVMLRDKVLGVVTFAFTNSGRRYHAADLPVALDLARRAAHGLERASAFSEERRIAETLQQSMLPDVLPDVPGILLCARYLAGGKIDVGGDWYDVVPLTGGRYGLAIGDVAGHGVRAATVMGQLRNAFRAFAADGNDPATVLARLNRFVFEQGPLDMATLCYGVLDPLRGRFEVATAGHMPPVLLEPDADPAFVDVRPAPPIGADIGSRYSTIALDLAPGSTLLFYTDGLVERRGETLDAGLQRMLEALRYAPSLLDATCDLLLERLLGGRRPADDVAVLGMRFVGTEHGHLRLRRPARAAELAAMRRILASWLETAGVPDEDIGVICVATSEAATNAIEHAYGPKEGWFEVEATVEADDAVTVIVRDAGRWRPKARGGGGRGLTLIGRLMDEFELVRRPAGTEVWMRRAPRGKGTQI
ncbi:MAG TPA: SpoIIE family protein phosphatase [Acidimicrobiia bacterium]|nr:SpoIIE family protein phosphatase [Acidimicrobiia bacterium]